MDTVLLVGGGGFIGQHAAAELARLGWRVYATHRPGSPVPVLEGVRWVAGDLTSEAATSAWPARCDHVLFLAQARSSRSFPDRAADTFAVNVAGLMRVAEYARRAGARQFTCASTGSVYSQTREPAKEREPFDVLAGRSFYAASKLAGELLLGPYEALFPVVVLRIFMPYGPGQCPDMLFPSLVRKVREGRPIQLHGQDGLLCNPVAVGDVVEGLRRCLGLARSATLNLGGPRQLTLRQIGNAIGHVVGAVPVFEPQPGAPPVIVGDCAALKDALGWAPSIDLESGLREWLESERMSLRTAG
jgi:nucleoside-diphosphate-sugar epimerase